MVFSKTVLVKKTTDMLTNMKKIFTDMNTSSSSNEEMLQRMEHFKRFGNIMICIETLSTKTNASIIEITAMEFNKLTGEIGDEFNTVIIPSEWAKNGRDIDGYSILCQFAQNEGIQEKCAAENDNMNTLMDSLCLLTLFIKRHDNIDDTSENRIVIWGNSNTSDISILQSAYEHFDMKTPWEHWAVNDCRTIANLMPEIENDILFEGEKHNPSDNCKYQIKYLSRILRTIKHIQ